MIRILILFLTLNAIFPSAVFASVCVCDKSKMHEAMIKNPEAQHHCNHSKKSAVGSSMMTQASTQETQTMDRQSMNCDAACCDNCLGVSVVVLTSLPYLSLSHPLSMKPVSGKTNFYTYIISPELRPPLV